MRTLKSIKSFKKVVLTLTLVLFGWALHAQTYEMYSTDSRVVYALNNTSYYITVNPGITRSELMNAIYLSDGGTISLLDSPGGLEILSPDTVTILDTMIVACTWSTYSHYQEYTIKIGPKVESNTPLLTADNTMSRTGFLYGTLIVGKGSEVQDLLNSLIIDDGAGQKQIYTDVTLSSIAMASSKLKSGEIFMATSALGISRGFSIDVENYTSVNFSINDYSTFCGNIDTIHATNYSNVPLGSQYQWYIDGTLLSTDYEPAGFVMPAGSHTMRLVVMDKYNAPVGDYSYTFTVEGSSGDFIINTGTDACPDNKVRFQTNDNFTSNVWYIEGLDTIQNVASYDTVFSIPGTYNITLVNYFSQCVTDTITKTLTISSTAKPYVEAGVTSTKVCSGDEIGFFPVNTWGDGYTYLWEFSDGSSSTEAKVSKTIDQATWQGYAVLSVTNSCGNTAKDTVSVDVVTNLSPEVNINYSSAENCPSVPFELSSSCPGDKIWDFGDGTSSTGSTVIHSYALEGYYTVKLLVTNGCGKSAMNSQWIQVVKTWSQTVPSAVIGFADDYNFNDTIKVLPGKQIKLLNNSDITGGLSYFTWNFGDSTVLMSDKHEVFHTYSDTITTQHQFWAKLTVEASCGGVSVDSCLVIVDPNLVPQMDVMVIPDSVCVGDPVYVVDNDPSIMESGVSYSIDFGDGFTVNNINVKTESNILATHSYSAEGVYDVIVAGNNGVNTQTLTSTVVVQNDSQRVPFYHILNTTDFDKAPGQLYYYTAQYSADSIAYFAISSLYDTSGTYDVGYIYLGNKISISEGTYSIQGSYMYLTATQGACIDTMGTYTLSFTTGYHSLYMSYMGDMCSSRSMALSIGNFTLADLKDGVNEKAVCVSDTVYFKVYGGTVQEWNFGDGETSAVQTDVGHKYATSGFYDAYAKVQNSCGRIDTIYTPVEIGTSPNPRFNVSVSNYTPTLGDTIYLSIVADSSTLKNYSFKWVVDLDSVYERDTASYAFNSVGQHKIEVDAYNNCGTIVKDLNFIVKENNVIAGPNANVSVNSINVFGGQQFVLDASTSTNSTGGNTGLTFEWKIPAGFSINGANLSNVTITPVENVTSTQTFYVILNVYEGALVSTRVIEVYVNPRVIVDAGPDIEINEGEIGTLSGSIGDGYYYGYSWAADSGIEIYNPGSLVTQFKAPKVFKDTWYRVVLSTYAESGGNFSDTLWVKVMNVADEIYISNTGDDTAGDGTMASPYKTIQKGVDVAPDSSTLVLLDGTFLGTGNTNVVISNKSIWITSYNGYKLTKINAENGSNPIFDIKNTTGTDTIGIMVNGINFMNSDSGIVVKGSMINLQMLNNRFDSCGNSITLDTLNAAKFSRNIFNVSAGHAIKVSTADSMAFVNNTFFGCDTAILFMGITSYAEFKNNIVVNGDWGVYVFESVYASNGSNNDFWNMLSGTYNGYSNVYYDISGDPLFAPDGSFRLMPGSPCIDAGSYSEYDSDGTTVDIGAIPTLNHQSGNQTISLKEGWNIFSTGIMPTYNDMIQILQPLIDGNVLVKVQDQAGNTLENISSEWIDEIGTLNNVQGYKIKVSKDTVLTIVGLKVDDPVVIPLKLGWNISGYPAEETGDISLFADPLLAEGSLVKIQSQSGAAYEYLPGIGWVNNIKVLTPGQGYKTKVSFDTQFVHIEEYSPQTTKSYVVNKYIPIETSAPVANTGDIFTPSWVGYGLDHMNIFIASAKFNDSNLETGDMIGVFDGEACVGVYTVPNSISYPFSIKAIMNDPTTGYVDGFTSGHQITLKIWRKSLGEYADEVTISPEAGYSSTFAPSGTTLVDITASKSTTGIMDNEMLNEFTLYPNPTNGEVKIKFSVNGTSRVNVEVLDLIGNKVAILPTVIYTQGEYTTSWNGQTVGGKPAASGVYLVNVFINGAKSTKKLVVVK